jgi:nucleoside permease NupC
MDLIFQSAFGFVAILFLAWLASENRRVAGTLATCMTGVTVGMLWTG